jgi:hypothetical protein
MTQTLWTYLSQISTVVGLLISIPVFWTWWQVVFGEQRRRRRQLMEVRQNPGNRPGVLIVDLLEHHGVRAGVEAHLASDENLKSVPKDRIVMVKRDRSLRPDDTLAFVEDLRNAVHKLADAGVDVIHVFCAGPVVSAMMVGAVLANGKRVTTYQYHDGHYYNFGPLQPPRFMTN